MVLPQQESEILTSLINKTPVRTDTSHLVTPASDPFLGLLSNEENTQHQTSPEQTEDEDQAGKLI